MVDELTIVCFLWGNWCGALGPEYVNKLYRAVSRHLTLPHKFVLFTDKWRNADLFTCDILVRPVAFPDWKWNLKKMQVYAPDDGLQGRVLMLDLDIVITGSIDDIAQYSGPFATCEAAYHPRLAGGSITGFEVGNPISDVLWQPLIDDYRRWENITDGSERKYYRARFRDENQRPDFWQNLYPGQVLSYKVDCRGKGLPSNARIVRFHGSPRPHEVMEKEEWIKEHWI